MRMGLASAPRGLRFPQDLINTVTTHPASKIEDLLGRLDVAQTWLDVALGFWADASGMPKPAIALQEKDLAPLRRMREALRATLPHAGESTERTESLPAHAVSLDWDDTGQVVYKPNGSGSRAVASLVAIEVLLAQHLGTWGRLKSCGEDVCGIAFFDSSPNASRVWHDTKTCGNRHNLRASRARRGQ
jgi:predicted RNA-binding Zn ribbon-like protein